MSRAKELLEDKVVEGIGDPEKFVDKLDSSTASFRNLLKKVTKKDVEDEFVRDEVRAIMFSMMVLFENINDELKIFKTFTMPK
jgi:hypothetical protein